MLFNSLGRSEGIGPLTSKNKQKKQKQKNNQRT